MIGFVLRAALRMLALAGLLYVCFFVPLGARTFYGHAARIAATPEAHELFSAISQATLDTAQRLTARIGTLKRQPSEH